MMNIHIGGLLKNNLFALLAQLEEQYTFNVWVLGSSPKGRTNRSPILKFTDLKL